MPELPEVETVRRHLAPRLPGRRIAAVETSLPRTLQNTDPERLRRLVVGETFGDVGRRGKFLLLSVGERARLIIHLRMTGRLLLAREDDEPASHTRVVFYLDGGKQLRFADVRTFGTIHYSPAPGEGEPPSLAQMGPEPLSAEFTPAVLARALAGRRAPVKAVLLDQRRVAGLGNIYVDEALYLSGVHPSRPGGAVDEAETERLHENIRFVLQEALRAGGTTIRDYVDGGGNPGRFGARLQAYGRAGEECNRCGGRFERLKVAGRSSHVCSGCQR